MSRSAKQGFLVVADITGYTAYLSDSELEHAKDVLKVLLDLLIDHTRAPLAVSGLEGDAVLSYSIDSDRFEAQAFVEIIEQTYVSFKRAIELMVMNTSCECNACANIGNLDLKFFVHHGEFALQVLGNSEELVGSDVILIHRLMKNTVTESTGIRAYTLYTQAAIDQLGLAELTEKLRTHEENLSDLGRVRGWIMDMRPIWEASKTELVLELSDEKVLTFEEEYPLPPEQVWGYLTNPEHRAIFADSRRQKVSVLRNGRVGAGSVYECFHMDNSRSTNTILEWQPFSRIVSENTAAKTSRFLCIIELEPSKLGTHVSLKYGVLRGPLREKIVAMPRFFIKIKPRVQEGMTQLRQLIDEDIANGLISVPDRIDIGRKDRDAALDAALTSRPSP